MRHISPLLFIHTLQPTAKFKLVNSILHYSPSYLLTNPWPDTVPPSGVSFLINSSTHAQITFAKHNAAHAIYPPPMPTQLIIQNPSLIKHGHKRPPHTQPSTLKTCKHSQICRRKDITYHLLPGVETEWAPQHMHTRTHTFTHSLTVRGWVRKGEQESEREKTR